MRTKSLIKDLIALTALVQCDIFGWCSHLVCWFSGDPLVHQLRLGGLYPPLGCTYYQMVNLLPFSHLLR